MERTVAVKRLRKMLGPKFGYEINPKAPSDEERTAAQAAQKDLHAKEKAAADCMRDRMQHLLDSDEMYQQLKQQYGRAREARQENSGILLTHKITVGIDAGMFFRVEAQAHSWEDIFKILERREQRLKS